MSRAQQMKSGDVSLGLAHEWVCAFGRQGGERSFLQQTLEDPAMMAAMVAAVAGGYPISDDEGYPARQAGYTLLLERAVQRGVRQIEEGLFEFEDPGLSFNRLQAACNGKMLRSIDARKPWASREATPQMRRILLHGFGNSYADQVSTMRPGGRIATPRETMSLLVINTLAMSQCLFPEGAKPLVRTSETEPDGPNYTSYINVECDQIGINVPPFLWDCGIEGMGGLAVVLE